MSNSQNRRSQYFIDSKFQGKVIGFIIFLILVIAAGGIIPLAFQQEAKGPISIDSEQITSHFNNVIFTLLVAVILGVILTILYGVRLTHRIVGPISAFNRNLNWITEGNYMRDLKLREKDEFKNLAQVFNKTQAALRRRSQKAIDFCGKVDSNLSELGGFVTQEGFDAAKAEEMIKRLKEELEILRQENEKYLS